MNRVDGFHNGCEKMALSLLVLLLMATTACIIKTMLTEAAAHCSKMCMFDAGYPHSFLFIYGSNTVTFILKHFIKADAFDL